MSKLDTSKCPYIQRLCPQNSEECLCWGKIAVCVPSSKGSVSEPFGYDYIYYMGCTFFNIRQDKL